MEVSKFSRRRSNQEAGFSLIEVLLATVVLTVGLVSLAALMSRMDVSSTQSRYLSTASMLASEKLEQLASLEANDPGIRITSGTSAGSLTSDTSQNIAGTVVGYYDKVLISATQGTIAETSIDTEGEPSTIVQRPEGGEPSQTAAPPVVDGAVTFKRRWLIENNLGGGLPPQVRRITVLVQYPTGPATTANLQMSMVRNGSSN